MSSLKIFLICNKPGSCRDWGRRGEEGRHSLIIRELQPNERENLTIDYKLWFDGPGIWSEPVNNIWGQRETQVRCPSNPFKFTVSHCFQGLLIFSFNFGGITTAVLNGYDVVKWNFFRQVMPSFINEDDREAYSIPDVAGIGLITED